MLRILVAEDDPLLRNIYVKKFTSANLDIVAVADGDEALREIEARAPDLIILDINMPKVDGFQVLEKLPKSSRAYPVILLTNFDQESFRTRGASLGADGFFVKKDMSINQLLEMVKDLLGGAKAS